MKMGGCGRGVRAESDESQREGGGREEEEREV